MFILLDLDFPVFFCIALDQHQALCVCLNLLVSSYNNFRNRDNLANNQLYNNLLDQLQSFEFFNMILKHLLLADQKSAFHQSKRCSLFFLQSEENIASNFFNVRHFQMIKLKSIYSWKLGLIKWFKYQFCVCDVGSDWYLFQLSVH